jgi:hypothetical protein
LDPDGLQWAESDIVISDFDGPQSIDVDAASRVLQDLTKTETTDPVTNYKNPSSYPGGDPNQNLFYWYGYMNEYYGAKPSFMVYFHVYINPGAPVLDRSAYSRGLFDAEADRRYCRQPVFAPPSK